MKQRSLNKARYAEKLVRQAFIWEDEARRLRAHGLDRLAAGVHSVSQQFGEMGRALRD